MDTAPALPAPALPVSAHIVKPDFSNYRALDTETFLFRPGEMAPPIVCASTAQIVDGQLVGDLHPNRDTAVAVFKAYLDAGYTVAYANAAFDLAVLAQTEPSLFPAIFRALAEGKIHDILVAESLNAIYTGLLGLDPRTGGELRSPSTRKPTKRYSLEICTDINLDRVDAKANDTFRKSYALLAGMPVESWPLEARTYPIDDAKNTLEVALVQIFGREGTHAWDNNGTCTHCGLRIPFGAIPPCPTAPRTEPHKNLQNLPAQVEAAFALHLGACHSLRTDGERVAKLEEVVNKKHAVAVERFQKQGWIRADGSEDTGAVRKSIAVAYGVKAPCARCAGTGKVRKVSLVPCRGVKLKGRYQGCYGSVCLTCAGKQEIEKDGGEITCKNIFGEEDRLILKGCDGTGLDLDTVPVLPRTKKDGVSTDRDTLMESGDEELADFGENEFEKSRSTYVPYLRTGIYAPLKYSPNVIVATGRCSYEGSPLHQMPRSGGERECIRARGAWCGSPVEYVLGSTDYEAGELCTLSQMTYWLFGYSKMRDAINESGKPGILHSDLASEVLGIPLDEFLKRLKAKDKQAVDFRQMCKPINFGLPGKMGVAKLVLTSRKKNAGFTLSENGPAVNEKGHRGYWGVRFCILTGGATQCGVEKITSWKRYPCAPICKACAKVVDELLKPAYFRRYPEIKDYFKWVDKYCEQKRPAPCVVWSPEENAAKIIRERGGCEANAFANNSFQAMLSDVGKHAFVTATRECYLGVKADGAPSPLAGCRLPLYLHDEPLSELIRATAHLSGPRIADIMMESGRLFAPDVIWRAETALALFWSKSMEPVYDTDGKLIPWEPKLAA